MTILRIAWLVETMCMLVEGPEWGIPISILPLVRDNSVVALSEGKYTNTAS